MRIVPYVHYELCPFQTHSPVRFLYGILPMLALFKMFDLFKKVNFSNPENRFFFLHPMLARVLDLIL